MNRLLWLAVSFGAFGLGQDFDLLLKGGRVVDPRNGRDGVMDVAIRQGRIAAIEPDIDAKRSKESVSVRGCW